MPLFTRTVSALGVLAAFGSPALAHPGHHHETTLTESLAHVLSSADHIATLALAGVCAVGAIMARITWARARTASAKAHARSRRS